MVATSLRRVLDRPETQGDALRLALIWLVADLVLLVAAARVAAWAMNDVLDPEQRFVVALITLIRVSLFWRMGLYRAVTEYTGTATLMTVGGSVAIGTGVVVLLTHLLGWFNAAGLNRAFLMLDALLSVAVCGGARVLVRSWLERGHAGVGKRTLIYGAGAFGDIVARQFRVSHGHQVVGFLDDDPVRHGEIVSGIKVLGDLETLPVAVADLKVEEVVVAIREVSPDHLRACFTRCMALGIPMHRAGDFNELGGRTTFALKDVPIEELLSRPRRSLDPAPVQALVTGKTVVITGAGGSIGSELCRQLAGMGAVKLVLVEHSEFSIYAIDDELRRRFPNTTIIPVLDDLSDPVRLAAVLRPHAPTAVFHAAAYKHVPMVEANPFAGVRNNVRSFRSVLAACDAVEVERLVLISTDKAVRPTNVMGASKRVCELLMQNAPEAKTRRCCVRFGNVLGSSGSVIPKFLEQIAAGGPVTVTHPEMTRYFMLIPEAVELVLQAGAMAERGEVFILDMGQPVRIADLARQLIILAGRRPGDEVPIAFTGLRPGEKLYEELLHDPKQAKTRIRDITIGERSALPWDMVSTRVASLLEACDRRDGPAFVAALQALVPEWVPSGASRAMAVPLSPSPTPAV